MMSINRRYDRGGGTRANSLTMSELRLGPGTQPGGARKGHQRVRQ